MIMAPFRPAGDQARWKAVYELLKTTAVGDVVSYERIAGALELDPVRHRHAIQMAMRRAAAEHELVDKRAVAAVPNEGYRIVPVRENLVLARRHQRKAGKSLARGESKVVNADLSALDPETRRAFEVVAIAFRAQSDMVRRLDVRQARLEETIAASTRRVEEVEQRTDEEIAALKARLARLEQHDGQPPAGDSG
jgi:chromosome segregation ATPase